MRQVRIRHRRARHDRARDQDGKQREGRRNGAKLLRKLHGTAMRAAVGAGMTRRKLILKIPSFANVGGLCLSPEPIADALNRFDEQSAAAQFLTKRAHHHIHDVASARETALPHVFQQLTARHSLAAAALK
jgi:hypothetical protein